MQYVLYSHVEEFCFFVADELARSRVDLKEPPVDGLEFLTDCGAGMRFRNESRRAIRGGVCQHGRNVAIAVKE
ncbi:MAG: hypothetical protein QG671_465 [Actinomycetota bacterium]|nr:hypothetical protein [Actinomycetota bacterium]